MKNQFYKKVQEHPIIAAVNDLSRLNKAIDCPCEVIFLLRGSILDLKESVDRIKEKNKEVYVHMDLLEGLSKDQAALKFIKNTIHPSGIISTKSSLIRAAKDMNMFAIQRLFLIDSLSLETGIKSALATKPDAIEILPGIMPRVTTKMCKETKIPIINGGLITLKEEVISSLKAGAMGISTTNETIWYM